MRAGADPIRVLLDISPVCAPVSARTGLARVALALASALARRRDVELTVIAWGWVQASLDLRDAIASNPARLRPAKAKIGLLERTYAKRARSPGANGSAPGWIVRLGQAINVLRNPVRGLDPASFDLVHTTYSRVPRHARRWGLPVVQTIHDLTPLKLRTGKMKQTQAPMVRRILDSVEPRDWIVPISNHTMRDFIEAVADHPGDRIALIHDAVDHDLFNPVADTARIASVRSKLRVPPGPFLLTMSSLAPHKNVPFLLGLWTRVRETHPGATLVVAGGKSVETSTLASRFGAADGVWFTGFLSDDELTVLLSACEAFLFPSLYEGFGLPVLEAMACGAPVIASNRTAIPEVTGDAAILLDPEEEDAWISAINEVLESGPRTCICARSIHRAARFNWDSVADEYVALYRRALDS